MNSYSLAERINSDVNASVTYKTDLEQYDTPEIWREAGTFGDCEDYALRKRELLLNAGFARKDLHLACRGKQCHYLKPFFVRHIAPRLSTNWH
jgi:predicted transglutaminase-like cysteine proteinase